MTPSAPRFNYLVLLAVVLFPLYLTWTFDHSLWNPDETRDAGIAREMYVEKNFSVPVLNGVAFLEKPPLYYWSCAAVYAVAGRITAGLTRLPAALYGILGALFTFLIGRRLYGERAGFMAAVMLATSVQYFRTSHFALMDSSLAAFTAGAFYFHLAALPLGFIAMVILGFYAKGFVAVALIGLVVSVDLSSRRQFRRLAWLIAAGAVVFAVAVSPWVWKLWAKGGRRFLEVFFVDNNFRRFFSETKDHREPFYFYFGSLMSDFLPWTFLFVLAAVRSVRTMKSESPDRRLPLLWFGLMFLFLSASKSKRSLYLMPAFPAAALIAGSWLDSLIERANWARAERGALAATFLVLLLCSVGVVGIHIEWNKAMSSVATMALPLLAAALLAGAGTCFQQAWIRRDPWRAFLSLAVFAGLVVVTADGLLIRNLDDQKSFVPLINMVKQRGNGATLAGFDLSEMERGVFYFYLEEPIPNLLDATTLRAFVDENRHRRLLVLMNRNKIDELGGALPPSLKLVDAFRPGQKSRSYVVYANEPESGEETKETD